MMTATMTIIFIDNQPRLCGTWSWDVMTERENTMKTGEGWNC